MTPQDIEQLYPDVDRLVNIIASFLEGKELIPSVIIITTSICKLIEEQCETKNELTIYLEAIKKFLDGYPTISNLPLEAE